MTANQKVKYYQKSKDIPKLIALKPKDMERIGWTQERRQDRENMDNPDKLTQILNPLVSFQKDIHSKFEEV